MAEGLRAEARLCAEVLQRWYRADSYADATGLYRYEDPGVQGWQRLLLQVTRRLNDTQDTSRWWNNANAITALIGYMVATSDRSYVPSVSYTHDNAPRAYTIDGKKLIVTSAVGAAVGAGLGTIARRLSGSRKPAAVGGVGGLLVGGASSAAGGARIYFSDFIGEYYDDMAWWALAWIDAYDLTGHAKYLQSAQRIFDEMTTGWDDAWGGGVYWRTDRQGPGGWAGPIYKNAITNEQFIAIAAGLAARTENPEAAGALRDWALRGWRWFSEAPPHGVAMINDAGLVNDSPNPAGVNDNTHTIWTYNQGVILGGLIELSGLTGDESYVRRAESIADAFIVTPVVNSSAVPPPASSGVINGILHERTDCDPTGTRAAPARVPIDGAQFKGVFIRNLARLYRRTGKDSYREFIVRNAETAASFARDGAYGANWAAPPDATDFVRQSCALDLMAAAVAVEGDREG
jgi:predicted alpha-1,6-mannanase (GH76 family)